MPRSLLHAVLLASSVAFASPHAGAEPTSSPGDEPDTADPGRVARARALFDEGVAAYAAGRYYDSIERFTETARLYPNQQLSFNIAKAYDNLGNRSAALRYYREYLRSSEGPPDGATVARVEELEQALAQRGIQQLSVLSDPKGATVLLDGQPVGLTPWTGETWPGAHRVELAHTGYVAKASVVELDAHRSAELEVRLEPEKRAASRPSAESVADPLASRVRVVTWAALATATASLGTAVVIEVADDSGRRGIAPASAFFAGLGTAAATAGGVLLYFDLSEPKSADRGVSIGAAPGGALATYRSTF
ncbi:MAG TPA: PEGA domain-containing protein [Polyangiaceae bacterium]